MQQNEPSALATVVILIIAIIIVAKFFKHIQSHGFIVTTMNEDFQNLEILVTVAGKPYYTAVFRVFVRRAGYFDPQSKGIVFQKIDAIVRAAYFPVSSFPDIRTLETAEVKEIKQKMDEITLEFEALEKEYAVNIIIKPITRHYHPGFPTSLLSTEQKQAFLSGEVKKPPSTVPQVEGDDA